jgi:hypothetical protein
MTFCLRFILIVSATIGFIFFTNSVPTKTQATGFGFCRSDPGSSPVYVSNVFDFGTSGLIDTNPIQNEFNEYLRGRFEYKTNGPGAGCLGSLHAGDNMQQTMARRRDYEAELRQDNKQIVEVDWTWVIDPDLVASAGFQHRMPRPVSQGPTDTSFCFSETYVGTVYVAGPVQTGSSVSMGNLNIGFTQYLKQRYSFQGRVNCNMGTRPTAARLVAAHIQGARAGNKNVVETDWHFDSSVASVTQQQDEDPEPAPTRPTAPTGPQSELQLARVQARAEEPASRAYCQNDPILKTVFSCQNFAAAVTVFRVAHRNDAGAREPVARVLEDPNFVCTACVTGPQVFVYVNRRAMAEKLNGKVKTCLERTLEKNLNNNIHHIRELDRFYKESVAECSQ